jgi:hypothetical protein
MVFFVSSDDNPAPKEKPVYTPGAGSSKPKTGSTVGSDKVEIPNSSSGGVWFPRPTPISYEAKENVPSSYSTFYSSSDVAGAYQGLDPNLKSLFTTVAKSGGGRSGSALFDKLSAESKRLSGSGIRKSPIDLLYEQALSSGILSSDGTFNPDAAGSKTGGRGSYTGPTATTTLMNENDLRSTANAVASTVLGRGITDEEFQKVLKQVRTAERAEPTITTSGVGSSVTQSGLSAEGRQDIIREALMKGPEAEDYGKATKMMDLFYSALEERPDGA